MFREEKRGNELETLLDVIKRTLDTTEGRIIEPRKLRMRDKK